MRKGERTRQQILEQTAPLFNQHGFSGASLGDVMRVTGLQKGGIYNHFTSKEALALEAFDYAYERVSQRLTEAVKARESAGDRLLAILDFFREVAQDSPIAGGCPVMNTAIESDDAHPVLRARAREAMDAWRGMIQRIVQKGIERGEIRPDAEPDVVTTILITTLEGAVMLTKLYDDPVHIYRAVDHLTGYIERDLCGVD